VSLFGEDLYSNLRFFGITLAVFAPNPSGHPDGVLEIMKELGYYKC